MAWSKCLIHAIFSVGGYILFGVAAVGSGIYLYLQRYSSPEESKQFFNLANKIRYRMNCAYLIIGFVFYLIGLVLGAFQARNIWGSFISDAKTIFSFIILAYYTVLISIMISLYTKKSERAGRTISIMAIIGAALLLINVVLLNFLLPTMHRYL